MTKPDEDEKQSDPEDVEAFLREAEHALSDTDTDGLDQGLPGAPGHRRLRITVPEDGLEARLEAVFPRTTWDEAKEALGHERISWGIREDAVRQALAEAERTGRAQRDVVAAEGQPAVYKQRKTVTYPFLAELHDPETGEPLNRASRVFREIRDVLSRTDIDLIRGYAKPVVGAPPGTVLMVVQGEDAIESGRDVYGKEIRTIREAGPGPLRPGDGVAQGPDGSLKADRFGYVTVSGPFLSVISPVWISPNGMEAYFVDPPQLGQFQAPDEDTICRLLEEQGVCSGIDRDVIRQMCLDLKRGDLRESCVRIAKGDPPKLSKGQINFTFQPLPPARFEAVRDALRSVDLKDVLACEDPVAAVSAGALLAEQAESGGQSRPGTNLFGDPVAASGRAQEKKIYKAGINVRREVREGLVRFVSDIYGYAGILEDKITVLSPLWIPPDRMAAYFIAYPQTGKTAFPSSPEMDDLLERARVRNGIDPGAIAGLAFYWRDPEKREDWAVRLARGRKPTPGDDGTVELLYKQMPDPGRMLESGKMDFRERDAVPQAAPGDLLAKRTLPKPGYEGMDVRGRVLKPPRTERQLLYAGPNVEMEEEDDQQFFRATAAGWPRVVKDSLGVMQRFQQRGDVDYKVGNLKLEGDVEIDGNVKSRFTVEATGDVYVGGTLERSARVEAGGNVVVRHGIIRAKVKAGGSVCAGFIQEADVSAGQDLLVRNYVRDSDVHVGREATIQGDEGGERQLCLLGGTLVAGARINAASVGSPYGRQTRVIAGVDASLEAKLGKYRKGLEFAQTRARRAMRAIEATVGGSEGQKDLVAAIRQAPPGRQAFISRHLKELEALRKLRQSLEHYVEDMDEQRASLLKNAQVRVLQTAFTKATVQIGPIYRSLEKDTPTVAFRLNDEQSKIVQAALDR